MKKLIIIPALFLAACQTTDPNVIKTEYKVVMPDQSLFNCPIVRSFPSANGLTDIQVARLIVQLQKNNQTCKNSINAIQKFLDEAQKIIESEEQK